MVEQFLQRAESRRSLLKKGARLGVGTAIALSVAGCSTSTDNAPKDAPKREDYVERAGDIEDPILRSASVLIYRSDRVFGHGGLYRDENGFYLMTQNHVIEMFPSSFHFLIPGFNSNESISIEGRFKRMPSTEDRRDPNVSIYFPDDLQQEVNRAVNRGDITPLERISYERLSLQPNDRMVISMADRDELCVASMGIDLTELGLISLTSEQGYICKGYSGAPVLAVEDTYYTNRSTGLVTHVESATILQNKDCGEMIYMTPH